MKKLFVCAFLAMLSSAPPGRGQSFLVTMTNGSISTGSVSFEVAAPSAVSVTDFNVEATYDYLNWLSVSNGTTWRTSGVLSVTASFTNTAAFRALVNTNDSVNAPGFMSQTVITGRCLIAHQFVNPAGNDLDTILTNVPTGSIAYQWVATNNGYTASSWRSGSWSRDLTFAPGEGIELFVGGTSPLTINFIGNLPVGTFSTTLYTNGSIVSAYWPTTGDLTSVQGYSASVNDLAYRMLMDGTGHFNSYQYYSGGWSPSLSPRPGESFWYYATNSGGSWSKTLSVW